MKWDEPEPAHRSAEDVAREMLAANAVLPRPFGSVEIDLQVPFWKSKVTVDGKLLPVNRVTVEGSMERSGELAVSLEVVLTEGDQTTITTLSFRVYDQETRDIMAAAIRGNEALILPGPVDPVGEPE